MEKQNIIIISIITVLIMAGLVIFLSNSPAVQENDLKIPNQNIQKALADEEQKETPQVFKQEERQDEKIETTKEVEKPEKTEAGERPERIEDGGRTDPMNSPRE